MSPKIMGSTPLYMTPREAAKVLGVSASMVDVMDRRELLDAYYPEGPRAGKRFLSEDIFALAELRSTYGSDLAKRTLQIAIKAAVASRRVERKLDDIMTFLGVNDVALSTEKDDVMAFHMKVIEELARTDEDLAEKPRHDEEIMGWAKKLLALSEDYFALVRLHLLEETPWELYLELAHRLVARTKKGTKTYAFMEHARAAVRNAAYFYDRGTVGPKEAKKTFPGEHFSKRLIQRVHPV